MTDLPRMSRAVSITAVLTLTAACCLAGCATILSDIKTLDPDTHDTSSSHQIRDQRIIPPVDVPGAPGEVYVALIIDDAGQSIEQVIPFLGIPVPLSFGILPWHAGAAETSRVVSRRGHEVLVHQPMEPHDPRWLENDTFLCTGMTDKELTDRLALSIEAVPTATGLNNHMGSKICSDQHSMNVVMRYLKERGLYYLDSRTTRDSVARDAADKIGLKALSRDVFLDNVDDVTYIDGQIQNLVEVAKKKGCAVGIGHARSATATAIMNYVRKRDPTIIFVPAGRLFDLCPAPDQIQPE